MTKKQELDSTVFLTLAPPQPESDLNFVLDEIREVEALRNLLRSSRVLCGAAIEDNGQLLRFDPNFVIPQLLKFTATLGPLLGAVLGAWVQSKVGRKIRIKIGDFEGEAQTTDQLKELRALADEYKCKYEKKIHES